MLELRQWRYSLTRRIEATCDPVNPAVIDSCTLVLVIRLHSSGIGGVVEVEVV